MEPWWTLRIGSVPFWMVFNNEPSAAAAERYLDAATDGQYGVRFVDQPLGRVISAPRTA